VVGDEWQEPARAIGEGDVEGVTWNGAITKGVDIRDACLCYLWQTMKLWIGKSFPKVRGTARSPAFRASAAKPTTRSAPVTQSLMKMVSKTCLVSALAIKFPQRLDHLPPTPPASRAPTRRSPPHPHRAQTPA
jgi:hypothetical protein